MKYRKKPITVEVERFLPELKLWPEGVYEENGAYYIDTLEGRHVVTSGDWIITGVKGERYPCKPDVFEKTYELVEEMTEEKSVPKKPFSEGSLLGSMTVKLFSVNNTFRTEISIDTTHREALEFFKRLAEMVLEKM